MNARRTYELLERLGNLLRAEERRACAVHGLQPVQLHALAYLARCNRYSDTPAAVTDYLGVTKGTASQTLARLQEKGLVRARPDRSDARKVRLAPTAKGRRVLDSTSPPPAVRAALERVSSAAAVEGALESLLVALLRENGNRSFGVCRTCRHFRSEPAGARCGLIDEPLSSDDALRVCREHEPAS